MSEKISTIEIIPGLSFAHLAPQVWEELQKLKRSGWVECGVKNPETDAEHVLALKQIAQTIGDFTEVERKDLLDMLEIHDWPEAVHGDPIILDHQPDYETRKKLRFEQEHQAMIDICEKLSVEGQKILALWMRFETSDDAVASLARQLDKYQAVEKALEYEKEQGIALFREFYDYSEKYITHPVLLERMKSLDEEWHGLVH